MTDADRASSATVWSLSQPSARRSLILCALGALLGLTLAGLGLFTAKGTRTSNVPAEDAALVNQVPILMSDYVQQIRTLYDVPLGEATAAQKKKTLDDMIREELYVQRGIELGTQADTIEVRAALLGAVEAQSAADATMAQPSEAQLRAYYDKNRDAFASEGVIEVAEYLLPSGSSPAAIAAATQMLRAARGDTPALRRSGRMTQGEEYYFAARIHLGERLFAVARQLKPGEVSPPVAMPDGVHLIYAIKNAKPVPEPFESARDKVLTRYVEAQAKLLTAVNERFLRKRADVQVAPGLE